MEDEEPDELVLFDDDLLLFQEEPAQETEDDLTGLTAEAVSEAVVTATDWTTETILSQLRRGTIDLNPRFQRRDAWTDQRKSAFIESIFLGLPIPQLVLAEQQGRRGYFLVIDGKQRLLALQRFAARGGASVEPLVLGNLVVRHDLNGMTFQNLEDDPRHTDDLAAFDNHTIRTVVVRNWPNEEFLYLVFHRLNTGSLPLSPQELRQALLPGPFMDFVLDLSESNDVIHRALRVSGPDFRMRDVEMLVRYFGFLYFLERYRGNLKAFLDETCLRLNEAWPKREATIRADADRCIAAMEAAQTIFGIVAFRRWSGTRFEGRFNRTVYDIMTYYFREQDIAERAVECGADVKQAFIELSETDEEFAAALQTTTKTVGATAKRLAAWGQTLQRVTGLKFAIPRLDDGAIRIE